MVADMRLKLAGERLVEWIALGLGRIPTPLAEVAAHRDEAAALVDELKFNQGAQN